MRPTSVSQTPDRKRWRKLARAAWLAARCLVGLTALAAGLAADWTVPKRYLPWSMLDIADEITPMTRIKLWQADGQICRTILGNGGVTFAEIPEQASGAFCSKHDAITVKAGTASLAPRGAAMTCREALAFAIWERQVVQPAATARFGQAVTRIDHYGTYSCRRMYGAATGRISEHASANALDVASFTLADGRRISVLRGWKDAGDEGAFLHEVRDGACDLFAVTLSPDYNAAHRNHLHLDMGRGPFCR